VDIARAELLKNADEGLLTNVVHEVSGADPVPDFAEEQGVEILKEVLLGTKVSFAEIS